MPTTATALAVSDAAPAEKVPLGDSFCPANDNLKQTKGLGVESRQVLDSMHARYYSNRMGRFLSLDPVSGSLELPQSWNRFGYVLGNPINMVDLYGLEAVCKNKDGDNDSVDCAEVVTVTAKKPRGEASVANILWGVVGQLLQNRFEKNAAEGREGLAYLSYFALSQVPDLPEEGDPKLGMIPGPKIRTSKTPSRIGPKIEKQLGPRGWTREAVDEAIASGGKHKAVNKATGNQATRHVHPRSGQSVVVDDVTGEIIHVGGPGFRYGPGSGDLP